MTRTRNWENSHKQVWIDNELFENLMKEKVRDESVNSYIGYLYEFHKNALPQIGTIKVEA